LDAANSLGLSPTESRNVVEITLISTQTVAFLHPFAIAIHALGPQVPDVLDKAMHTVPIRETRFRHQRLEGHLTRGAAPEHACADQPLSEMLGRVAIDTA